MKIQILRHSIAMDRVWRWRMRLDRFVCLAVG
jgi:hypothetical protein